MYYYRPARGSVHESMRKLKTFKTKKTPIPLGN